MRVMRMTPDALPDDIDALKSLVAEQATVNEQLLFENRRIKAQVLTLQEQLNLALAKRYAASSEKCSSDQIRLFDEAEVDAESDTPDTATKVVAIAAHTRTPCGRKALPEVLPRIEVIHELPEAERHCPHDGAVLVAVGDVVHATETILAELRRP